MQFSSADIFAITLISIASFILGSTSLGYFLAKARGIDLQSSGSGNIGATNATRVLGKRIGILTLVWDIAKGVIACTLLVKLLYYSSTTISEEMAKALLGTCAVYGHCFSIFLNFKGGKGIATAAGVFAATVPGAFAIACCVFFLTAFSTRYISLASVIASTLIPVLIAIKVPVVYPQPYLIAAILISALTIIRHKENLHRLVNGKETKF